MEQHRAGLMLPRIWLVSGASVFALGLVLLTDADVLTRLELLAVWVSGMALAVVNGRRTAALIANANRSRAEAERNLAASLEASDRFVRWSKTTQDFLMIDVCEANGEHRLEWVNDALSEATGWSIEELCAMPISDLIRPVTAEEKTMTGRFSQAAAQRSVQSAYVIRRDGSEVLVDWSSMCTADGRVYRSGRDVTQICALLERLELEKERLAERNAELVNANTALQRFTSVAAHQMQAPPRTIVGLVGVLLEDYSDGLGVSGVRILRRIAACAEGLTDVVSVLHAMGNRHAESLSVRSYHLHDLIKQAEMAVRTTRGGAIETKGRDVRVLVNAHLTVEALMNLIDNAWKFNRSAEPTVAFELLGETRETVTVTITDNGIGLSPGTPHLFELFRRHTDEFPGTGVGLGMVKQVVEKMGGQIQVVRHEGGARFELTLIKG